ncbi:MAG: single-stranded-DNA-specific exonuclease RecJ [Porticoccaceae bacterium]
MGLLSSSEKSSICPRDTSVPPGVFGPELPDVLQRIYAARGIASAQELELGLDRLPAPDSLAGLSGAVDLLCEALAEQWSILIVGDYDVDGATSTALMILALRAMGYQHIDFLVPNRFEYGYGLTPGIVGLAQQQNPDLIITVDNGISSIDGVAAAHQAGIRVLVTDHHLPGAELPAADAIVNPNQATCQFPSKHLAGVGVAFYVLSALRTRLRDKGWFKERGVEPNMATWLDLVALGTVADVVGLDELNRILVHQGLQRIRAGRARPGILALLDIANREHSRMVASDLGFAVGPRLNAAGRLDDMSLGIQCLLEDDPFEARALAVQLDEINRDRRVIEADMQRAALVHLAKLDLDVEHAPKGLCLFDPDWHQGVVGLLASRVKDRLHRPVIAFACADTHGGDLDVKDTDLKGSGRSIPGLHMRDALDAVATRNPGLISRFGGHAAAAGLSLPSDNLEAFAKAFDAVVSELLSPEDLNRQIATDGELASSELDFDTAQALRAGGPWGQHFPEPCFYGDFTVAQWRVVGVKHLKLTLSPVDDPDTLLDAIAFNTVGESDAGAGPGDTVFDLPQQISAVYRLDVNHYRGRDSLQLMIDHLII